MKTLYQCEICGAIYDSESLAVQCESSGIPEAKFERGYKFMEFEVRSRRLKSTDCRHYWSYDVRRETQEEGIYQYLEFSEEEIAGYS